MFVVACDFHPFCVSYVLDREPVDAVVERGIEREDDGPQSVEVDALDVRRLAVDEIVRR